jgi:tRNA threonylcarbamoyladenosine biosynthesis protein TsaB
VAAEPLILAIESSGEPLSIALARGERLLGFSLLALPRIHDRMAAELIRRLLQDCNLSASQLDAVAISAGPGSFTSLRIGASLAKGLCMEGQPALVPVPTLEALAEAALPAALMLGAEQILACIPTTDAPDAELFVQRFAVDSAEPAVRSFPEGLQRLRAESLEPSPQTLLCGPAAGRLQGGLRLPLLERLSAEWIAASGLRRFLSGQSVAAEEFLPLYGWEFTPRERH